EALWQEIELIKNELVSDIELEKVKNKMLTYMAFSENDLMNRAIGLCYHEMLGDANGINKEESRYMEITAMDIQNFAKTYLNINQSSTLFYLKKK
ncbi:MAG: insulinase family protein, partial [Bacteroidetes bacterium]|nr:insulinase family protein [Bacteroidota bacterium]